MDIRQVSLDLKWIGVGFLDLAIFLRVFWNAIATSNINSGWKHPIHLWKPCQLNPCPSVCYLHVLTKEQGKGKWALPKKILPRLWTTIWQRGTLWKTLFQNKPSGTINPVYLPRKLLNKTKNASINKTLSNISQLFSNMFDPAALKEHPINNNDLHVFCFGKRAMQRNASTCMLWTWGRMLLKGIFLSNF